MKRTVNLGSRTIEYNLEYKRVKNLNLRIKPDCSIHVSANKRVSVKEIEAFIRIKADFILKAIEKFEKQVPKEKNKYFDEGKVKEVIHEICKKVYPAFESRGIKYPVIKFRKMVSQWGSCNYAKGIITFNTSLMFAPYECIEYVVIHEFCHFLQPNHSKLFYAEVEKLCPNHKMLSNRLKDIKLR